jgi:plasminogen activator inhibitor 1 RNA-binding protein
MSNFFAALDDSDNEGKAPAPAITKKKAAPKKEVVEPSKVEKRPNKGDRNTRGGRNQRPPARDGKRQYDRRSGTGRGREVKKGGGGGHNWGSNQNDAKKAEGPVTEGNEEANTPEETATEEKAEEEVEEQPEPEPEDTTMSYEEYLATKAKPDTEAFAALEIREVENEFAGKAASKKEEEDFMMMGSGKQLKKKGTGKKEKQTLDLGFKVKGNDRGGDDRGGRRDGGRRDGGRRDGGRRDGGRGGDRGGRSRGNRGGGRGGKGLDTNDASAFPSL